VASYREGPAYRYMHAFREAAHALVGADIAAMLEQDLHALQDRGFDQLGDDRERLRQRYAAVDHPMAAEVVRWLDGADTVDGWVEQAWICSLSPVASSDLPFQHNRLETSVTTGPTARLMALTLAVAVATCLPLVVHAQAADKATINALEGYFDFVDANAGTILPEQIPAEDYKKFYMLDVRDAAQFAKEHVPGAANELVLQ
jgi:hypothetical protein